MCKVDIKVPTTFLDIYKDFPKERIQTIMIKCKVKIMQFTEVFSWFQKK